MSPFPCLVLSSLCVCEARHIHCVCAGWHTPTHCAAVHHPLSSSLSVSLFHHHHPQLPPFSLSLRETSGGNGKHHQHTCVFQTTCGKRGAAQTRPGLRPQRHSPHLSLFAHCVVATLSAASLTQPHKKSLSCKKKREEKRDYDTWCSQVVSNPSTNQARRGLTSLIRREVVLSSWYGRNIFFRHRFVDFWQ